MTDKNLHKDIPQPKIINVTKESHPQTWAILEGKNNTEDKGTTKK